MSDKNTFGGELAKNLPVKEIYSDLAQPALSTVGKALQGATRVALAPITALVWGYDKIAEYLDVAIPEYFAKRKIAGEHIKSPDPSVAVPLIEAMRYTSHKPELRNMFTKLLGASMNSEVYDEHPAFVEIIKQLCSDECKMLKILSKTATMPMLKQQLVLDGDGKVDVTKYFSDICYLAECEHPEKFPEYLDNLHRLGLIEVFYDGCLTDDTFYVELRSNPFFQQQESTTERKIVEKKSYYELSQLGVKFCSVCVDE